MQHRERVHEPVGLGASGDREAGVDDPPVVDADACAEPPAGLQLGTGLAVAYRTRDPDRAELLRVALVPAPDHREVLVDPDQDAPRVRLAPVSAPDDDERLLVLGAHRVKELLERVRARLPVREDHGDRVGVVVGRFDRVRQPAGDRTRSRPILDRQQVARVVPRRTGHHRGPALGRERRNEPPQLGHGRDTTGRSRPTRRCVWRHDGSCSTESRPPSSATARSSSPPTAPGSRSGAPSTSRPPSPPRSSACT